MGDIADASSEQSRGVREVSDVLSGLDTVIQRNAAESQSLAAVAEETAAQATSMRGIVQRFRVS